MVRDTHEDVVLDYDRDETTPIVRICPDCTAEQVVIRAQDRLPATYGEAVAIVRCCGYPDWRAGRWCRSFFVVTRPRERVRVSFDKRVAALPVEVDRRRPTPIPPDAR